MHLDLPKTPFFRALMDKEGGFWMNPAHKALGTGAGVKSLEAYNLVKGGG